MKILAEKAMKSFGQALKDYFNVKGDALSDISIDVIEKNSENNSEMLNLFLEQTNKDIIDKKGDKFHY